MGDFFKRISSHVSDTGTGWEDGDGNGAANHHDNGDNTSRYQNKTSSSPYAATDLPHFHDAIRSGNKAKVELFLPQHPDIVDLSDHNQRDALHLAVMSGNMDMVRLIATHAKSTFKIV